MSKTSGTDPALPYHNALAESRALCRTMASTHGKSFYFASFFLPPACRVAMYALYAFCRTADDLVDRADGRDPALVRAELAEVRATLTSIYDGLNPAGAYWPALTDAIRRYRVPIRPFLDLLDGVEMDLDRSRYRTFEELEGYCYRVASTVGLMLCHVFGFRDASALPYAAEMGKAMQLTNILRDVAEDLRLGRLYLPQAELAAFGVDEEDLRAGRMTPAIRALMRYQVERARALYRHAHQGVEYLDNPFSRFTAHLMGRIYGAILDEIERRDHDVLSARAFVSTPRKIALLAACVRDLVRPHRAGRAPEPVPFTFPDPAH
ncbi:phytoene/squalene synthase family protein [bacterium]|nr:phytoene/squalene synthase family protein [bacterium]